MNEKLILELVGDILKENRLTYEEFNVVFKVLSQKEQYEVCNILDKNGIELVDFHSETVDEGAIDEYLIDYESILEDSSLFKDNIDYDLDFDFGYIDSKEIKQSNEMLCTLIQQGSVHAKQDLCIKNKLLVAKYAHQWRGFLGSRMSVDDLIQEGYVGLLRAADRFDVTLNNKFTTYATWWIMQCISRAIMDTGFMIRLPVHMMERIQKVTKLISFHELDSLSYGEYMLEISRELDLQVKDVERCLDYKMMYLNASSLDVYTNEEGNTRLIDLIENKGTMTPVEFANFQLLKDEIDTILQALTEREEKVLRLRFGLVDGRSRTLEEVGREFNVTRERIRQIEAKALRKLKHLSGSKNLKHFLEG